MKGQHHSQKESDKHSLHAQKLNRAVKQAGFSRAMHTYDGKVLTTTQQYDLSCIITISCFQGGISGSEGKLGVALNNIPTSLSSQEEAQ